MMLPVHGLRHSQPAAMKLKRRMIGEKHRNLIESMC